MQDIKLSTPKHILWKFTWFTHTCRYLHEENATSMPKKYTSSDDVWGSSPSSKNGDRRLLLQYQVVVAAVDKIFVRLCRAANAIDGEWPLRVDESRAVDAIDRWCWEIGIVVSYNLVDDGLIEGSCRRRFNKMMPTTVGKLYVVGGSEELTLKTTIAGNQRTR